jgi:hypothetical protein
MNRGSFLRSISMPDAETIGAFEDENAAVRRKGQASKEPEMIFEGGDLAAGWDVQQNDGAVFRSHSQSFAVG